MGLLDDAIREHLDLKRRRGGDPVEIERAEQEALGPVRRGPEDAEQPPLAPSEEAGEELDYEHEAEPQWDERYGEEDPVSPAAGEGPAEPRSEPFDQADRPTSENQVHEPAPAIEHPEQETTEYSVEEHVDAGKAGEDVLEETPEFLQDTPEHDRLWFEQRPPRDFDFDE